MEWLKPEASKQKDARVTAFPALKYLTADRLSVRLPKFVLDQWKLVIEQMDYTFLRVYPYDPKIMSPLFYDGAPMQVHFEADDLMRLGESNVFGHLMSVLVRGVIMNQLPLLSLFFSNDIVVTKTADSKTIMVDMPVMQWTLNATNDNDVSFLKPVG